MPLHFSDKPADPADYLPRPEPVPLDGCTCGGIGDTGAHRPDCPWYDGPLTQGGGDGTYADSH